MNVVLPARNTDPVTSHEGMISEARLRATYENIIALYRDYGPQTDVRLFHFYLIRFGKISPSGLRTRRSELVTKGRVKDTDFAYPVLGSNRRHIVWGLA